LYHALGGNHDWRMIWFRRVTIGFLSDTLRQTILNLKRDNTLWKWSTFRSAASFLFGKRGLYRRSFKAWRAYTRRDFHPRQQDSELSHRWLMDNAREYSVVSAQ
jgi:predicted metal-dependent hydrolase